MIKYKLLMVSPIASHPTWQGNSLRINAVGQEFKRRGFEVDFLYYGMEGLTDNQKNEMEAFWNRLIFIPSLPVNRTNLKRFWHIDDWIPDELVDAVRRLCKEIQYDAVFVNYVWMSRVFDGVVGPLKILDTHDIFADRHLVLEKSRIEPRWFFTSVDEENRGFARADIVIGIQDEESAQISGRYGGITLTLGHLSEPVFLTSKLNRNSFQFGYLGSGNPLNVQSLIALDNALYVSGAFDWVVAGSISERQLHLTSAPFRMGTIEKSSQFYNNVECILNPMSGGTGLKIKTIEALANGKALIGTVDAFRGIPSEHPFHKIENMDKFAEAMAICRESRAVMDELRISSLKCFLIYTASVGRQYDELCDFILRHALE